MVIFALQNAVMCNFPKYNIVNLKIGNHVLNYMEKKWWYVKLGLLSQQIINDNPNVLIQTEDL